MLLVVAARSVDDDVVVVVVVVAVAVAVVVVTHRKISYLYRATPCHSQWHVYIVAMYVMFV